MDSRIACLSDGQITEKMHVPPALASESVPGRITRPGPS
jgi:hypothetical protein